MSEADRVFGRKGQGSQTLISEKGHILSSSLAIHAA